MDDILHNVLDIRFLRPYVTRKFRVAVRMSSNRSKMVSQYVIGTKKVANEAIAKSVSPMFLACIF